MSRLLIASQSMARVSASTGGVPPKNSGFSVVMVMGTGTRRGGVTASGSSVEQAAKAAEASRIASKFITLFVMDAEALRSAQITRRNAL
jgi:hypothetical protein